MHTPSHHPGIHHQPGPNFSGAFRHRAGHPRFWFFRGRITAPIHITFAPVDDRYNSDHLMQLRELSPRLQAKTALALTFGIFSATVEIAATIAKSARAD
jgi:hypothetical protein